MKPYESEFRLMIPRRKQAKEDAVKAMSKRFGGVTIFPVLGAWVNPRGKTIYDKNYLLFSTRDLEGISNGSLLKKDKKFMEKLGRHLGIETGQEQIWIEEDIIKDVELLKIPRLGEVV